MNPSVTPPIRKGRLIPQARAGFALVATLSLMVLLAILVVGLMSLSAIALRKASAGNAEAEARANARLALMLAVGELQKSLGSDGAITAPATILDSNPETPEPDGIYEPHLTGVWTARRDSLESPPSYDRSAPFRRWLVSTGDQQAATRLDMPQSGTLADPVLMVASAAGGGARAGRVKTGNGAFAWWVGDENAKARVGLRDDLERAGTANVAELLASMATPGGHGIRAVDGFADFPSNTATSDKLISRAQIDFTDAAGGRSMEFFHDLSPYSESVLADVTAGSLRQDLSLYLERQDINWLEGWGRAGGRTSPPAGPLGPNGEIALSDPLYYDVLSWKSLHHWYNMHRRQLSAAANHPLLAMRNYAAIDPVSNPTWNSGVMRIAPVTARMQMVVSYGLRKKSTAADGTSTYDVFMYSYPVLTLWNPYSVGLQVDQWSLFLHTLPIVHTVYKNGEKVPLTEQGTYEGNFNWGWPKGNMVLRFGGATGTPGLTFAPGEAKTLSYLSAEMASGFHSHNMVAGLRPWLPPSPTNPAGQAGMARLLGTLTGIDSDRIEIETKGADMANSGGGVLTTGFETTFDFRTEAKAVHTSGPTYEMTKGFVFSSQVAWRSEVDSGNPMPDFISRNNFPSSTLVALNNSASPFLQLDVRLKTLDEVRLPNKTWLHTIPHHPFVAATSTSKHSTEVDAATTFYAHPYTYSFEQINGIEGVVQNQPFFGPSNSPAGRGAIVAQDIPLAPLTSLAQLQNLPQFPIEGLNWSGYHFQNHAIGNSHASPGLAPQAVRERSFPFTISQYFPWVGGDAAGKLYPGYAWFNNADYEIPHAPAAVIDRSYSANHLLFDSYFFSSLAGQTGAIYQRYGSERQVKQVLREFFDGTRTAPNAAYRPHLADTTSAELVEKLAPAPQGVATDAHRRAAAHLMAAGGFNVNSTSIPAWTAMLASAHLKRPVTLTGGSLQAQDQARFVVSRFSAPVGGAADGTPAMENNRWLGYRELTAEEVRQLAEAIVKQVKLRGPFRSLGEFVNRRLTASSSETELALYGALQAALEDPAVTINAAYRDLKITAADLKSPQYSAQYKFPAAALGSRYQGTPAYISQADILTPIAPILNARSDTFLVRGYGEARSSDGSKILASAWCEAVFQRVPEYIDPADAAHTPEAGLVSDTNRMFGRRFLMKTFRWLSAKEVEPA